MEVIQTYPGPSSLGDLISDFETNRTAFSTSLATGLRRIQDSFTTQYQAISDITTYLNEAATLTAAGIGGAGTEFAPMATGVTFLALTPATSDGTLQQQIKVTWASPGGDFFSGVELIYTPDSGVTYYSLGPSSTSPFIRAIVPPDPQAIWTFYLVSRDIYGRSNTITAATPFANLVVGISSSGTGGTLDFTKAKATSYDANIFKVQSGKFIVWAFDGSLIVRGTLNVGGGIDRPDKLVIWQDDTTAIGYIGLWGEKNGTVNTTGTAVHRVSGDAFVADMAGRPIIINGVQYLVSTSVTPPDDLVLTATAGNQTGVVYQGWTNAGLWAQEGAFGGTGPANANFVVDKLGNATITGATLTLNLNSVTTKIDNSSYGGYFAGLNVTHNTSHANANVNPGGFRTYDSDAVSPAYAFLTCDLGYGFMALANSSGNEVVRADGLGGFGNVAVANSAGATQCSMSGFDGTVDTIGGYKLATVSIIDSTGRADFYSLSIASTERISHTGVADMVSLKIGGTERISSAGDVNSANGISATIALAKLTAGGANGWIAFTGGVATSFASPT